MSYHSNACKHSNPRDLAHTYTEMVGWYMGRPHPRHDSYSHYGPDISFRTSSAYFQNTNLKKKKIFQGLSFKEEHFCYNLLFCVCFGDKQQNGQMRETETDRQTDSMCCTYTEM